MAYVPRMLSLTPADSKWLEEKDINLSKFTRRAIEICKELDQRDVAEVVFKLRAINKTMQELLAAYQMDAGTLKGRI